MSTLTSSICPLSLQVIQRSDQCAKLTVEMFETALLADAVHQDDTDLFDHHRAAFPCRTFSAGGACRWIIYPPHCRLAGAQRHDIGLGS